MAFSTRHPDWHIWGGLGIIIIILYGPTLNSYFISDDFAFLEYLHLHRFDLLNGQGWSEWLFGGIQGYVFFRPVANLFWALNYLTFKLNPFGYHAVSVLFHWLASCLVYLIGYRLTRERLTAGVSAFLFAVMAVHAEPVSWVAAAYDPISAVFFFASFLFFVLYMQQRQWRWYGIALGAFVAALCSKEIALTFPGIILLYDILFYGFKPLLIVERLKRHAPFAIAVVTRLFVFGHGYSGLQVTQWNWWGWWNSILLRTSNPLPPELGTEVQTLVWLGIGLGLWLARSRTQVLFGALWIPITFVPTVVGEVSDRSFYISSLGVALAFGIILARLATSPRQRVSRIAVALLAIVILANSIALVRINQAIQRAGQVAETILQQLVVLHPTSAPDERLVFVGLPDQVPEGPLVFLTGFRAALLVFYNGTSPDPAKFERFPIWLDHLDKTWFFEVDHRKVIARTDLIEQLQARARCDNYSAPFHQWDFSASPLDWESWNQLSGFASRDGALTMRAEGNDPIMVSPPIDLSTIAIGEIQIRMRVRATQPTVHGDLYWQTSRQSDFFPGLKSAFQVLADDAWHTYRIDIAKTGALVLGDSITRLRLNPTDAPAEIAIQSISISTRCNSWENDRCICLSP